MNIKKILMLLIAIALISCAPLTQTPSINSNTNMHLLFVIEGEASIKRITWNNFYKVSSGAFLGNDDILFSSPDAHIIVLCNDLSIWLVPSGIPSGVNNGCHGSKEAVITRPSGNIGNTRGSVDQSIPYTINPRASKILYANPTLRWNPVSGANSYKVQIEHDGKVVWETETQTNQLDYPGVPALKPDISYTLVIYSDIGKSSKDETMSGPLNQATVDLSFQLADVHELKEMNELEEKISSLDLSIPNKEYATSILYSGRGFYSEAMLLLENAVIIDPNNLHALLQLGNYQLSIGLHFLAKNNFETVVNSANLINDIELQSMALEALANVYLNIGGRGEAIQKLQDAEFGFNSLGDTSHAQELRELRLKITP
jgi:hypothetical protein